MKQLHRHLPSSLLMILMICWMTGCVFDPTRIDPHDSDRITDSLPKSVYCNTPRECQFASSTGGVCCGLSSRIDPFYRLADPVNTSDPTRKLGICSQSCDKVDGGKALQLCDNKGPLSCPVGRCGGFNAEGTGVCTPEVNCENDLDCQDGSYCRVKYSFQRPNLTTLGGAKCTPYPRPGDLCSVPKRRLDPQKFAEWMKKRVKPGPPIISFCVTDFKDFKVENPISEEHGRIVVPCEDDLDCEYLNRLPPPNREKLVYGCTWKSNASILNSNFGVCQIVDPGGDASVHSYNRTLWCQNNDVCERPYGLTCCSLEPTLKRCVDQLTCNSYVP